MGAVLFLVITAKAVIQAVFERSMKTSLDAGRNLS